MKKIKWVLFLISSAAMAVELGNASNEQLITELSRRLGSSSSASSVKALYTCRSGNYLYINLLTATGDSQEKYYNLGSKCTEQSELLNKHRQQVVNDTLIIFCQEKYLYRLSLKSNGTFGPDSYSTLDSADDCLKQMKSFNTTR